MNKSDNAILILHEIYGKNAFIESICQFYMNEGYDVFCPNMLNRPSFTYQQSQEAYDFLTIL